MILTLALCLVQDALWTTYGNSATDESGFSVAGCGDVDGDGRADVISGARFDAPNGFHSGSAAVLSGAGGALIHYFAGDSAGDELGFVVAGVGDINGDGVPDLLVGAPNDDRGGADSGSAFLYSGATGAPIRIFAGGSAGDHFGWSAAGCGDLDRDGVPDFAVGAPDDDPRGASSGSVTLFSGATLSALYTRPGDAAGDGLGWSVAGIGDPFGTGVLRVAAGAPFTDVHGPNTGSVYLFAPFAPAQRADGAAPSGLFGWSVAGAGGASVGTAAGGDASGDGIPDVFVGAPDDDRNGADAGAAVLLSADTAAVLWTALGDAAGDRLGTGVALLGDGRVAASAYQDDNNGLDTGSARVYAGASGETEHTFNGDAPVDWLGWSIGAAGDADNDGHADLVAGIKRTDVNGDRCGATRLFAQHSFVLSAPVPGIAGQLNAVALSGATPGRPVVLEYGFQSGIAPVPGCPGISLDMADPHLVAVATAGAGGVAAWSGSVPAGLSGRRLLLQAFEAGRCVASNRVTFTFP
ncbi:MAG: hypothetical protein EYC70_15445 [Planctomycetota bacterium]|nr:MAG: hypothetical protein EYC70_15445 [Planctomycetota bacterium]